MTVLILERAPPGVRGQLTRWMLEVKAGVFVGTLSRRVREKIWVLACERNIVGAVVMVSRARNEQGFEMRSFGDASRELIDFDGLQLVCRQRDGGLD